VAPIAAALAIAVLVAFAYRAAFGYGFLAWDDLTYVRENALVLGHRWGALARAVVSHNWHPLTMWSLAANAATPLSPAPFHATNVLLHALDTALAFALAWRLSRGRLVVAAFTALVFGLHPMHVESVAWISERKDVLHAAFYLAGLAAYVRHVDRGAARFPWGTFAMFALACLAKGAAVSFPLAMLAIDVWRRRPLLDPRLVREKLPFLALAFIVGMIAIDAQHGGTAHGLLLASAPGDVVAALPHSPLLRLAMPAWGYLHYAWRLFVPSGMSPLDPWPRAADVSPAPYVLALLFLLATLALAAWDARRSRVVTFAVLWYLGTLVFVLQWLRVGQAITADRYTYLPYIGPAFALGIGLDRLLARRRAAGLVATAAALAFVALLAVRTTTQVAIWHDDVALWSRAIAVHPQATLAYVWRGNAYAGAGRMDDARRDLETARRLGDRGAALWTGLGIVYGSTGHADSALVMFGRSLALAPRVGRTYYDRGVALALLGRRREALDDFGRAVALAPGMAAQVRGASGAVREVDGDWRGASADLEAAMAAGARGPAVLYAHAVARLRLGDTTTARDDLRQALRYDAAHASSRALLDSIGTGPAPLRPAPAR